MTAGRHQIALRQRITPSRRTGVRSSHPPRLTLPAVRPPSPWPRRSRPASRVRAPAGRPAPPTQYAQYTAESATSAGPRRAASAPRTSRADGGGLPAVPLPHPAERLHRPLPRPVAAGLERVQRGLDHARRDPASAGRSPRGRTPRSRRRSRRRRAAGGCSPGRAGPCDAVDDVAELVELRPA